MKVIKIKRHHSHSFSINRINNTKTIPHENDKEMDRPG